MELLYLACPYSHKNPATKEYRYKKASYTAAKLMRAGIIVFSPLSHSVPIAKYVGDVDDFTHWLSQDIPHLQRCAEMLILGCDGWKESRGVGRELCEALALGLPVTVIEEVDIDRLPMIPKHAKRFGVSTIFTEYDTTDVT
jgi:hypothetical protein